MYITSATPDDIPALLEKIGDILGRAYREDILLLTINQWPEGSLKYDRGAEIIGFLLGIRNDIDSAKIFALGVDEGYRRMGLGTRLMKRFMSQCIMENLRKVVLEVAVDNVGAQRFYKRFGFVRTGTLTRFYDDGKDAHSMMKYL